MNKLSAFVKTLKTAYGYSVELSQRSRTLGYLQTLSERSLLDKGFAPHLVAEGMSGYPWTAAAVAANANIDTPEIADFKTAA